MVYPDEAQTVVEYAKYFYAEPPNFRFLQFAPDVLAHATKRYVEQVCSLLDGAHVDWPDHLPIN